MLRRDVPGLVRGYRIAARLRDPEPIRLRRESAWDAPSTVESTSWGEATRELATALSLLRA